MSRKIFVSYEFEWKEVTRTLKSWFQPGGGTCDGELVWVFDATADTTNKIDVAIRTKMEGCDIALFVKSANVHNKEWIDREAELATSKGLQIVVVPLLNSPAGLPEPLRNRSDIIEVDSWSSTALCPVLNRIPIRSST
jgi:hypothetical protein